MKKQTINLLLVLTLVLTILGLNVQGAQAESSKYLGSKSVIPGSVRCGTLKGWGVWRSTADLFRTNRTVYFEPARIGTHKIQFFLSGFRGVMTPYWSNDGGKTWKSWKWGDGTKLIKDELPWVTYYAINLRTDTTKTIYKFVFYSDWHGYATYRFQCN